MPSIKIVYHFLLTQVLYKPWAIKMGKRVIICAPILITPKVLKLGSRIFIRDFARIEGVTSRNGISFQPIIEIESGVIIEQNLHLTCANSVTICKNASIGANVTITDIIHPYTDIMTRSDFQPIKFLDVKIGEDCRVNNNAVILPGVNLGKHCIVGANSVVLGKKYEDYSIITGVPAKVIKRYSSEKNIWARTDPEGNFI
jgi:acetyltransferase-like isoleucine patch superfamily enzyme